MYTFTRCPSRIVIVGSRLRNRLMTWAPACVVASGALFGVFFMGSAFGEAWHTVLDDPWGRAANLAYVVGLVGRDLFGIVLPPEATRGDLPTWAAAPALVGVCAFSLGLLNLRLRAREVVS